MMLKRYSASKKGAARYRTAKSGLRDLEMRRSGLGCGEEFGGVMLLVATGPLGDV